MLFSGTLFSTGAYSAEYGQALSSIVDMKTNSIETEEKSSVSVMTVGVMGSTTKCWAKDSLSLSGDYLTSGLSNVINKQQVDWIKSPAGLDGTLPVPPSAKRYTHINSGFFSKETYWSFKCQK